MKIHKLIEYYFIFIAVGMFSSGAGIVLVILDYDWIVVSLFIIPLGISLFVLIKYNKELLKAEKKIKELN